MSRIQSLSVSTMVVAMGLLTGCEAPLPPAPPSESVQDAQAAWTEWQAIAGHDQANWDVDKAIALTELMASEPDGLEAMIEFVGDEAIVGDRKVLAVISLTPVRGALGPYREQLFALTRPEHATNVRTFATHLLGLVEGPEALDLVLALLDDNERSVRESALGVLISMHGEAVADRLLAIWDDPETTVSIRDQIILGMSSELVERFTDLFAEAVIDQRMTAGARYKAATVLGQLGGSDHVAALEQCATSDPDPYVRERAEGGLALLKVSAEPVTAE